MSNKPQNVVDHRHFFAFTPEERERDEAREVFRFDACRLADGSSGVWDVRLDVWMPTQNYDSACFMANCLAKMRRCIETGESATANLRLEGSQIDFQWVWKSDRPLAIDLPCLDIEAEEFHPVRTLTLEEAVHLRDWLTESIDQHTNKQG